MISTTSSLRLVGVVAGVAVALALMGAVAVAPAQAAGLTQTQIQSIVSLLASFGADQATINNVTAALNGQATSGTGSSGGSTSGACPALSRDLQVGSSGADVKALQVYLNASGYTVAASGAGSMGNETMTFGPATKAAVVKLQTAWAISPAAGYVGPKTRAAIATHCASGSTGGTTGGTTTGGAVTVSAGAQPVNSLAPQGASRVPFTTFMVSNNSAAPVTVNSVTIQRVGLGIDSNFSGIVLLDQNGLQTGTAKTLNSNHQANLDGFTLAAGASQTFTVAGNISSVSNVSGQVVGLQVVAINTGATVSGSLPINGASQTINTTLTLGSLSTSTSSYDPGTSQNKNIGDTGVRFTGIRFTAGSAEDLKLYNIRWRQTGTAASSDISNVMTVVNGTSYPAIVDSTGKYYSTVFPGGLMIPKGNSVDVYIQGDVTGSNSATRTVIFNIDRNTDIYLVGQTYGYGVTDKGCTNGTAQCTNQPWLTGQTTTIQAGTASVIQNATSVASANIPVNVNNVVLGGFQTNFTGEPVSVSGLTFTVSTSSANYGVLTSVSIVNQNGVVVAGPVDQSSGSTALTFTDTVTFPVGLQTYTLKGKVTSNAINGSTISLSTTANSTNWTNPTGQVTGNTISLPGSSVTMNTQTVKGATLTVSASPNPVAQSIVAGNSVQLANIQLDASQSGEDVRLNSIPLYFLMGTLTASSFNTCQLWSGSTALNTGSRVVNSSNVTADSGTIGSITGGPTTFTFDNSLVVPKGTITTLALACNITSGSSGTVQVGVSAAAAAGAPSVLGVASGNSVTTSNGLTVNATAGGIQTVSGTGGSVTVAVDSSSPSRALVASGSTGVTLGVVKLRPSSENVNLTKVGLSLAGGNTKSTGAGGSTNSGVNDVTQVYLYQGTTLVGTALFTGTNTTATSTLNNPLALTKDVDTLLTIKADMATIGVSGAGGIGDVVNVGPLNAEGVGASSGTTIKVNATGSTNGVELFKSYPTVAFVSNATNPNGTNVVVKKFTVTASSAGSISLYQMKATIATSSASITSVKLYAYTDAGYSQGVANQTSGTGQVGSTCSPDPSGNCTFTISSTNTIVIPSGTTYYFAILGTVAPASTANNWTISPTLNGDSATTTAASAGYNANQASSVSTSNFVWSDNATSTAATTDIDWFNGYQVTGLPSTGI